MEATATQAENRGTLIAGSQLAGRLLIGVMFALAGWNKIGGYEGTQGYMASMGVPGELLPLVIALELIGGLALIVGYRTGLVALALAGFTLLAGIIFHGDFSNQMQSILFMKNLAITGGLLSIAATGAGAWSMDQRRAS
jgi:putative oxidoreductase